MTLIKNIIRDRLLFRIFRDRRECGAFAAEEGATAIRRLLLEKEHINVIFAAAPSQNEMLDELSRLKDIDWKRVRAFQMDEYAGFRKEDIRSFAYYLNEHIFYRVPFGKVYYIDGAAKDTDNECARYAALIRTYPPDIVFLGIGENGHIAFNDPWVADFEDRELVRIVHLDDACRMQQVHDGCFAAFPDVPARAFTLTVPALMSAEHLYCTVPGTSKTEAIYRTATWPVSENCPSTAMRFHPNALIFCDADSGKKLLDQASS